MQVRMKAEITGARDGKPWPVRGEIIDVPDEEAVTLLRNKLAESVPPADVETAAAPSASK
jgi:hypothetical protein